MKQKTYLDKLMENDRFKRKLEKELKLIKDLEDVIINIKKVIETAIQTYGECSLIPFESELL